MSIAWLTRPLRRPGAYNRPPFPGAHPLFLKTITISGFKSFARRTMLDLPPGITGLVGANGSGKTNVVDAIRWCLGEQSMRDLRGQRAEDVIYAGPRNAMGRAEVELVFERTDSEGSGSAETSIARRLYRSGDSEYLVDGSRVRLRDVQDALRTMGIDGARYVIVTQGMTDAWLSASPAERRALLEQAAGLASYRVRRDEARQKLATTGQNMQLIETVLAELEPRLRTLRRQARAVQERTESAKRLRQLLEQWYGWRRQMLTRDIEERETQFLALTSARARLTRKLQDLEADAERDHLEERKRRQHREAVIAGFHAAQREHDAASFSLREAQTRQDAATKLLDDLLGQQRNALNELSECRQRADQASAQARATSLDIEELRSRVRRLQGEIASRQQATDELRSELERRRQAAQMSKRIVNDLQLRIDTERRRARHLDEEAAKARSRLQKAEAQLHIAGGRVDALTPKVATVTANQVRLAAERVQSEEKLRDLHKRQDRLQWMVTRAQARGSDASRNIGHIERAIDGLGSEPATEFIAGLDIPDGWDVAVVAAIGTWSAPDGGGCRHGEALAGDFVAWRHTLVQKIPGCRWADTLVGGVDTGSLHPLLGTLFVDEDDEAREIWNRIALLPARLIGSPPIQVVARSGIVHSALGVATDRHEPKLSQLLSLRRDRTKNQRAVDHARRWLGRLDRLANDTRAALDQARTLTEQLGRAEADSALERATCDEELQNAERERLGAQDELARWNQYEEHTRVERTKSAAAADELERELAKAIAEAKQAEKSAHDAEFAPARDDGQLQMKQLRTDSARLEALTVAAKAHDELERSSTSEATRRARAVDDLETRIRAARVDVERCAEDRGTQEARLAQLRQVLESQSRLARELGDVPPDEPIVNYAHLQKMRRELAEHVTNCERMDAQRTALHEERSRLIADVAVDLQASIAGLPRDVAESPAEDEIRRLRFKAAQYPDAGEEVVVECRELEARYEQLGDHLGDLQSAADTLSTMMSNADVEMRSRFESAFDAVNTELDRVFRVMFNGGWARLEVVDADGGIGIRSQLPGKRAQSASGFSGGERALLASSLLFGVLKIRPTPFCVLDEVDAALDESNVERYLAALRDISARTQVVVVTHNRATMAAADVLYGVTMNDDGVSGLLSVRLDAYQSAG